MKQVLQLNSKKVFSLYHKKKLSMREISEKLNVSIDAVVYCMRKNKIPRRTFVETRALVFKNKKASFTRVKKFSRNTKDLEIVGAMLYWAEGYKSPKNNIVDFTNSDPWMIIIFLVFLRTVYNLDEKKFRIYLYCYKNQNVKKLIKFWSKITRIPINQFSKPYIRTDFREDGRKMENGMIHIRYSDKKLFLDIMNSISQYKKRFCVGGRAVKYKGL